MNFEDLASTSKASRNTVRWQASGCGLEPIASYLKSLGLLRQLPNSQGWWDNGQFWVECDRTESEAVEYLAAETEVSPLVSPWNGSCGLWKADRLIERLATYANHSRTKRLIRTLNQARAVIEASGLKKQPSKGEAKTALIEACNAEMVDADWRLWRRSVLELVEVVTKKNATKDFIFSRLLGTGGNIGAKDLGYTYLEAWAQLIDLETGQPLEGATNFWQAAIFGASTPNSLTDSALLAQYAPAADYALDAKFYPYQKSGGSSTAMANPADAVLLIEGLLAFSSIAKRPLEQASSSTAEYSLAVSLAAGMVETAVSQELRAGLEEFWLPIWSEPRSFESLREDLFAELRGPLPRQAVPDSFDFVALLASKANERKIPQWQRYAFFPRKGQSNFAISLGTFSPESYNLGAELDGYRRTLAWFAYSERAPGKIGSLSRQLESQLFALASGHGKILPLLSLLGEIELYLARSPASQESVWPVAQLDSEWVVRALEEAQSPLVRLAISLSSLSLRSQVSNARPGNQGRWFWAEESVRWSDDLTESLIQMQRRWGVDIVQGQRPHSASRVSPLFADIAAFVTNQVDLVALVRLAVGFSLCQLPKTVGFQADSSAYNLLKLPALYSLATYCQWSSVGIGPILNQLSQGDIALAAQTIAQRLRSHSLSPFDIPAICSQPRQMAAAIAFPLSQSQLNQINNYLLEK